ncbi:MAG: DUF4112 domain-containing protein [Nitrospira sp.]|jgi:hypothetical protein|nr:DUF4112 domain-containing protein [Nitrospira sp.]
MTGLSFPDRQVFEEDSMDAGMNDADPERQALRSAAELLAKVLDSAIAIPGTRIRIGLDPLFGMVPGIGDVFASAIGSVILLIAARLQVPKIVLLRMGINLMINGIVGMIPVAGDAFSIWFQSNRLNARLLADYARPSPPRSTAGDWLAVGGVLLVCLSAVVGAMVLVLWLAGQVGQFLQ